MSGTATSRTLDVRGARLHYEIRGTGPVLLLIGLPMDSTGFARLAPLLAEDHTVVTYDPRGISGSTIDDPDQDADPDLIADDVHRLITALTTEPVAVFGSSGGAVTGIALTHRHPEQVRTLVAHEPPLVELLPDRAQVRAEVDDVYATHLRGDTDAAWAKFMTMTALGGADSAAAQQATEPEPPTDQEKEQTAANGDRMLAHCLLPTTRYRPDIAALRAAPTRIVAARGATSAGQLAHRTATAFAEHLAIPPIEFPGDHGGFFTDPESFATTLRRALAG
ncbi:clorobiocin biosynthesis protein CloN7 [Murinocardiopsis flavida]|uniref:Clorobiocin biosynthesis protein CloN7 n=1 Tax=Murinocardiopsis flavida TaxID=645275 RepID=A0A2P8D8W4_9ACTN|nr:alpha/beta hydrolase [Murinocardiopsis flavida]PSK93676.1 clorobiocin biosynthesis protein CloN7 [Murinocardiopsis flavida]